MIDLSKVRGLVDAANGLAQLQRQITANQQGQGPNQAQGAAQQNPVTAQVISDLSNVINTASTNPATPSAEVTDLQKQAALLSAQASALMAEANELESKLNLAPTPDYVGAEELFAQFKEILEKLDQEMGALMKKVREQKEENKMDLKQKPTAMKVGEKVGDPSFNTNLSVI